MTTDPHTLTGAYALDALPEDERREFEEHLASCTDCRREVEELQATAARLADAAVEQPPPGLRDRVMEAVDETRQERPQPTVVRMSDRERSWTHRLMAPAAAVLAILVVGLSVILGNVNARLNQLEATATDVSEVLTAEEVTIRTTSADGSTARVVAAPSRGEAAFFASGMEAAPQGMAYQLWMLDDGRATPAGVFQPGEDGRIVRLMTGDVQAADRIAVTVEPASGSQQPTSDPVMVVDL